MATDLRLQVLLSTIDKATKPMRDIMAGSQSMGKALKQARDRLKELDRTQADISSFRALQAGTRETASAMSAAQQRVAALAAQIRATDAPTRKLNTEFGRAVKEAGALKAKHQAQAQQLQALRGKLGAAGISTLKLSDGTKRLRTESDQLNRTMQVQKARLTALSRAQGNLDKARRTAGNLRSAGTSTIIAGGVAALPLVKGVRDALAFESAMADVKKVVDFDTPEQFAKMRADIQSLSIVIPLAQEEIAAIVAAAGQANIARKDLLAFSRDAAQMAVAFDISAGDAGATMARLRSGLKLTQPQVVELADKINFLGNTTAAGTGPITAIVDSVGSLGKIGGVLSGEIAAMGATMVAAGADGNVAATGIKNLVLRMTAGKAATKAQKKAFDQLGLSAVDLAKSMQEDGTGAITDLIKRIKSLPKEEALSIIKQIFGSESVLPISKLVDNLDSFEENLDKVSDRAKFSGSMFKEFAARADTVGNVLELTKNAAQVTSTELGQALLPTVKALATSAISVLKGITAWVREHPVLTGVIVKTAAALAVLVTAIGGVLLLVYSVIGPFALLRFTLTGVGVAMPGLIALVGKLGGALSLIGRVIAIVGRALLLNPIGLLITVIAVAAFLIIKYWGPISAFAKNLWGAVSGFVGKAWGAITGAVSAGASAVVGFVRTRWNELVATVRGIWDGFAAYFSGVWDVIAGIFTGNWERVRQGTSTALGGIMTSITAVFGDLPAKFLAWGAALIDGLIQGIVSKAAAVKDAIVNTAGNVGGWFADKLGINSPSRVFAGFGINTIEGLVQGLQAEKDGPLAALSGIVQRMRQIGTGIVLGAAALPAAAFDNRPPIQAGASAAAAASTSSITINVTGAPGMDTQALARAVRAEIEAFDRERAARTRSRFGDNN